MKSNYTACETAKFCIKCETFLFLFMIMRNRYAFEDLLLACDGCNIIFMPQNIEKLKKKVLCNKILDKNLVL